MKRVLTVLGCRLALLALSGTAACYRASNTAARWLTLPESPAMPPADSTARISVSGGARVFVAVFHPGGPAPVLLLHPGILSSDVWAYEVSRLRPSHEVIVLDTRGQGRSTLGDAPLSYSLFANDVVTILDSLHVARVAVVGWSDGGITALRLALDHPERLVGLLAFGANFDTSGEVTTPPDSATQALSDRYLSRAVAEYRRNSPTPDGFGAMLRAIGALESRGPHMTPEQLRSIRTPTTIVAAEHDEFVTAERSARLASLIPGARLRILRGVSHEAPLQDPKTFDTVVRRFISDVVRPRCSEKNYLAPNRRNKATSGQHG